MPSSPCDKHDTGRISCRPGAAASYESQTHAKSAASHDFVVVGAGPSGAHAAQGLLEAGERVLMLDAGFRDEQRYGDRVPEQDVLKRGKV
jgi:thioredoxin reductase